MSSPGASVSQSGSRSPLIRHAKKGEQGRAETDQRRPPPAADRHHYREHEHEQRRTEQQAPDAAPTGNDRAAGSADENHGFGTSA